VGRISLISGPVTLTDFGADEESDATLNWPLTSQQRLSTGRLGRAEVRIGSTSLRLDGDTILDFSRIDDEVIQLTLQRGTLAIRIRNREQLREIDLLTPRERIAFEDVGRYRIDVDRTGGVSALTTHVGSARVISNRLTFVVQSGQRGEVTAEPQAGFQLVTPASDVFDDWVAARDRRDDAVLSTRYVSPETTGLDEFGDWREVENYGAVWFPTAVAAGWAPYRYGRWAYVAPWGWTWIDDASWGFTPFHYGRWVYVHNAWGWVPGAYVARPCYSPALVAWYGMPGVSISVSVGGAVGWFPLGPGEIYIPGYYHSRRYINSVNYGHVTNINYITVINPPPSYRYRQPNFSTWAPSDAIVRRQPINRVAQPAPNEWARLPTVPHPPVKLADDVRRSKQTAVNAPGQPPRFPAREGDIGRRPVDSKRVEAPVRTPPTHERDVDRDKRAELPARPPMQGVNPPREPVTPPVQRTPRSEGPRGERAAPPRTDAPRVEPPRNEMPRSENAPPRQSKVQPVGAPPPQSVPRIAPSPRLEAPRQGALAPRPQPPAQKVAPPRERERDADQAQRPRPAPRQSEAQHN
jgi:hypothetical protein